MTAFYADVYVFTFQNQIPSLIFSPPKLELEDLTKKLSDSTSPEPQRMFHAMFYDYLRFSGKVLHFFNFGKECTGSD